MVWEQRWHPLREEWVIVAAHRQDRPWSGSAVPAPERPLPAYDAGCYLCPGNRRVGGARNPAYSGTHVFDNDHPCVGEAAPRELERPPSAYRNRPASGLARVVCYTPRHDGSLAEMSVAEIDGLLRTWQEQYRELAGVDGVAHVLVFENRGEVVGVSNPHPHCQIYATNFVFKTIETEWRAGERYLRENGRVLFRDVLDAERLDGRRVLAENGTSIAFVPYFARYAYEAYVAPKATHPSIAGLSEVERADFAGVLKRVLVQYDNLWRMPFPYVLALHQSPTAAAGDASFHFHAELHPPLRKPNLLKFLAGPEIGGGSFLSDTAPEAKAAELRAQPETLYRLGAGSA